MGRKAGGTPLWRLAERGASGGKAGVVFHGFFPLSRSIVRRVKVILRKCEGFFFTSSAAAGRGVEGLERHLPRLPETVGNALVPFFEFLLSGHRLVENVLGRK